MTIIFVIGIALYTLSGCSSKHAESGLYLAEICDRNICCTIGIHSLGNWRLCIIAPFHLDGL